MAAAQSMDAPEPTLNSMTENAVSVPLDRSARLADEAAILLMLGRSEPRSAEELQPQDSARTQSPASPGVEKDTRYYIERGAHHAMLGGIPGILSPSKPGARLLPTVGKTLKAGAFASTICVGEELLADRIGDHNRELSEFIRPARFEAIPVGVAAVATVSSWRGRLLSLAAGVGVAKATRYAADKFDGWRQGR